MLKIKLLQQKIEFLRTSEHLNLSLKKHLFHDVI